MDVEDDGTQLPASPAELGGPCSEAEDQEEHHHTEGWGVLLSLTTAVEAALLETTDSLSAVHWLTEVASVTVAAGYWICLQHYNQYNNKIK